MNNKELLRRATGITKAEGGTINLTDVNFDGILPREDVLPLINLTRAHSAWVGSLSSFTRSHQKGTIPIYDLNEPVMEHVGSEDPTMVSTRPETKNAKYSTEKHKANIIIPYEELREADTVDGNFEKTVLDSFTLQLNNDVGDVMMNGDSSLSPTNRLNRLRKGVDGIAKLTTAGSHVVNRGGAAFKRKNFSAIRNRIPARWRNDKSRMRWMYNDRIDDAYREILSELPTGLGDAAIGTTTTIAPMGIKPLLVPHISDTEGPTAIAPTSATDETTYIQLILTTLVTAGDPKTAVLGVGRMFLVTCIATGQSEVCEGFLDTTLRINTAGLLGQSTVSTTANHYTVRPYDETTIYLGDPKGISLVWLDEWRIYRKWNQDLDRLEIVIYLELDCLIPVPEMFIKATNIAAPPLPFE
jgi:hypothetical protein